jgi:hypothetical protein
MRVNRVRLPPAGQLREGELLSVSCQLRLVFLKRAPVPGAHAQERHYRQDQQQGAQENQNSDQLVHELELSLALRTS